MPSLCLAKLELTINTSVFPSGDGSPLVMCLCNPFLYGWEWAEGRYVLHYYCYLECRPPQWLNLMFFPEVEKFMYKWRKGRIVAEGKKKKE